MSLYFVLVWVYAQNMKFFFQRQNTNNRNIDIKYRENVIRAQMYDRMLVIILDIGLGNVFPILVLAPKIRLPSNFWYITHLSRQWICWSIRWSWSIACRRCSNYIFILDLTSGFNVLGKDNCNGASYIIDLTVIQWGLAMHIDGIQPRGPYPPCLRMADRTLFGRIHSIYPWRLFSEVWQCISMVSCQEGPTRHA